MRLVRVTIVLTLITKCLALGVLFTSYAVSILILSQYAFQWFKITKKQAEEVKGIIKWILFTLMFVAMSQYLALGSNNVQFYNTAVSLGSTAVAILLGIIATYLLPIIGVYIKKKLNNKGATT